MGERTTVTRTYDRKTYEAARDAWAWGRFGSEWNELKRIAWERGFPYPPAGTEHDDPDDPEPSQRAVIWQSLDERPQLTLRIVGSSSSWSQVVARLIADRRSLREAVGLDEDDAAWAKRRLPNGEEARRMMTSLRELVAPKEATE
jgi:hypothetical protein